MSMYCNVCMYVCVNLFRYYIRIYNLYMYCIHVHFVHKFIAIPKGAFSIQFCHQMCHQVFPPQVRGSLCNGPQITMTTGRAHRFLAVGRGNNLSRWIKKGWSNLCGNHLLFGDVHDVLVCENHL